MFGIYLHIPFCKQACHYCNYHFSTTLKHKRRVVNAIAKELEMRKDELTGEVQTIYLGGGTPSLLDKEELQLIFDTIYKNYQVNPEAEVTIETNPDDLNLEKLEEFKQTPINRLSIGVQSFYEEDLKRMNRAHSAEEAFESIRIAQKYYENITIDLMYGMPELTVEAWGDSLDKAFEMGVPHLSFYALTVEPDTALERFIERKQRPPVEDEHALKHYRLLQEKAAKAGYDNYEFSNFSKPGYYSQNNMAYWEGRSYLGIGPGAHGYDQKKRCWNLSNNILYAKAIEEGELPLECEELSDIDRYNEYVLTRLRTDKGLSLSTLKADFGEELFAYAMKEAKVHIEAKRLEIEGDFMFITAYGRFQTDGISGDLFYIED